MTNPGSTRTEPYQSAAARWCASKPTYQSKWPSNARTACASRSRYGECVKYTLTHDSTMYVDPVVAERIKERAIQPGELFQICKRQAKQGNRKTIYWVVGPDNAESQLERDLRASLERATASEIAPPPAPVPSANASSASFLPAPPPIPFYELDPSARGTRVLNGHSVPNGSGNGSSPARPSTDDVPPRPPNTQLAHALKTAIRSGGRC